MICVFSEAATAYSRKTGPKNDSKHPIRDLICYNELKEKQMSWRHGKIWFREGIVVPVPEPGVGWLIALGAGGVLVLRRRIEPPGHKDTKL